MFASQVWALFMASITSVIKGRKLTHSVFSAVTDETFCLQEAIEKFLGPPPVRSSGTTQAQIKAPTTPEAAAETLQSPRTHSSSALPSEAIQPPVMYTKTSQNTPKAAINARASWLAGRLVHRDAILSYTKIRHTAWLVPAVVVSSEFTEEVFWQWLHGLLPEVEYANRAGNASVSRLPHIYRQACHMHGMTTLPVFCSN